MTPEYGPLGEGWHKGPDGIRRIEASSVKQAFDFAYGWESTTVAKCNLDRRDHDSVRSYWNRHGGKHDHFMNGHNLESLKEQMDAPPETTAEKFDQLKQRIEDELSVTRKRKRRLRHRLDDGDDLDVDAWVQRDPDGWSQVKREEQEQKLIRIAVNVSVHCHQSADELLYRGAVAASLADVMIDMGYAVEISAYHVMSKVSQDSHKCKDNTIATRGSNGSVDVLKINVKDANMPMDMGAVCFALCEIAFARGVSMPIISGNQLTEINGGWGMPTKLPKMDREDCDYYVDKNVGSMSAANEWLDKNLKSFKQEDNDR